MKKKFIKLNVDDKHLSFGNFCRILKEYAVNKAAALQVEIFCTLFDVESIQDTTVNNYCIGYRAIGQDYKQKYLVRKNGYEKNKYAMVDVLSLILSILEGRICFYDNNDFAVDSINSNELIKKFCLKLYNISKNDKQVKEEFSNQLYTYIRNENFYECLVEILFFIILEKRQPIYEENIKKEILESILSQTSISSSDLEEYLNLKFCEGGNYNYSLNKLANHGNAYACFEIGNNEYMGYVMGYPRYDVSYSYLKKAFESGHPSSGYLIGRMFLSGNIGGLTNEDFSYAYNMFEKSASLGCISSLNSLGVMYLNGFYPVKKDIDKALEYFNKASEFDYVYAFNNIGKIYEKAGKFREAMVSYLKSANLGESWACNKVGEFYRLGIGTDKDLNKAFSYYKKALEVPVKYLCYYSKYNLAKYFYLDGCLDIVLTADKEIAINYLIDASNHDIFEASILLFYIYVNNYLKFRNSDDLKLVYQYKKKIECHSKYNSLVCRDIMSKLKEISNLRDIDISSIL